METPCAKKPRFSAARTAAIFSWQFWLLDCSVGLVDQVFLAMKSRTRMSKANRSLRKQKAKSDFH